MTIFAGESFLKISLPNYEDERQSVTRMLLLNAIFWVVCFPILVGWLEKMDKQVKKEQEASNGKASNGNGTPANGGTNNGSRRDKKSKATSQAKSQPQEEEEEKEEALTTSTAPQSAVGMMFFTLGILLLWNPHNYFTARRVFMAPLLSLEECQQVIDMAHRAAQVNLEVALEGINTTDDQDELHKYQILELEPQGWQKTRHASYPTTDLNLVTDPFTSQDRQWLQDRFHARLAPLLSRIFGIPPRSIRANDMFVVRYDAPPDEEADDAVHRAFLANHTDDSDISFNVLLNQDFEGGGTRFWDRLHQQPFAHVQPTRPGTVLTHSALINHEGATVTQGTRFILVGFLSVDVVDPFEQTPTGLTNLASWGSGSWLTTKFKQAWTLRQGRTNNPKSPDNGQPHWTDNKYARRFLLDLVGFFTLLGDAFATHAVETLVADAQAEAYLQALDQAALVEADASTKAVWWQGQGLHLDVDGSIAKEWRSRRENSKAFEDL